MTTEPWNEEEPLLDHLDRLPEDALDRPAGSPQFREALFQRSTAMLHRRRLHRRAFTFAGCLAAYAAGLATAYFALGPQQAPPAAQRVSVAQDAAPQVDQPSADAPLAELPPWELEQRSASAERAQRRELLRLAGDRYLVDYADVQSALRCYRQLLDLAPPDQQAFEPDDTWLLVSLKQARQSEAPHANTDT